MNQTQSGTQQVMVTTVPGAPPFGFVAVAPSLGSSRSVVHPPGFSAAPAVNMLGAFPLESAAPKLPPDVPPGVPPGVARTASAPLGNEADVLGTLQTIESINAELKAEMMRSARAYGGALPSSPPRGQVPDQHGNGIAMAAGAESGLDRQLFQRIENLQAKNQFLKRHQEVLLNSARTEAVWSARMQDIELHEDRLARLEEELRDRENRFTAASQRQQQETQLALQRHVIEIQSKFQEELNHLSVERVRMDRNLRQRLQELDETRSEQDKMHMQRMRDLKAEGERLGQMMQMEEQKHRGQIGTLHAPAAHDLSSEGRQMPQSFSARGIPSGSSLAGSSGKPSNLSQLRTQPEPSPALPMASNGPWGDIPMVYQAALDVIETHGWSALHNDTPTWTPLHWAASIGRVDICKYLVSQGADITFPDELGKTAIDYAHLRGHSACVDVLCALPYSSHDAAEHDIIEDEGLSLPKSINGVRVSQAALPDWGSAKAAAALQAPPVIHGYADHMNVNFTYGMGVLHEESD
eukprot:gnl/MRDRNA2_/MRDRNA2_16547_c0_seq1.p1 gnl/MRDRNA2_/MRDRNA2_16547_c0~~gnl/MRDRNA2_/MRDRNA2_16547_c0_seq1.p1  ORF type:complete len:566 (-),score=108.97 gnl/MRDRNA2_/MRDRNA2_16547_c0_seq1:75-1643(-)